MKRLNSLYQHLLVNLERMAFELGYSHNIHNLLCGQMEINPHACLHCRTHPKRTRISPEKLRGLYQLAKQCNSDPILLLKLLKNKPLMYQAK